MNDELQKKLVNWNSLCILLVVFAIGFTCWAVNYKPAPTPIPSVQAEYVPEVAPPPMMQVQAPVQSQPVQDYVPAPVQSQSIPQPVRSSSQSEVNSTPVQSAPDNSAQVRSQQNQLDQQSRQMIQQQRDMNKQQEEMKHQQEEQQRQMEKNAEANEMIEYVCTECRQTTMRPRKDGGPDNRGCPKSHWHSWIRH